MKRSFKKGGAKKYQEGGDTTRLKITKKKNSWPKTKEISEKKYNRLSERYKGQEGSKVDSVSTSKGKIEQVTSGRKPNKSVLSGPVFLYKKPANLKKGGSVKSKKK